MSWLLYQQCECLINVNLGYALNDYTKVKIAEKLV